MFPNPLSPAKIVLCFWNVGYVKCLTRSESGGKIALSYEIRSVLSSDRAQ